MKKFLSVILCIILFFSYFILEISINFGSAFSESSIKNISQNISLTNNEVKPEDITPENLYWETTLQTVYDIASEYNVSEEKVNDLLESENAKDFIANYINKISSSVIKNDGTELDKDEIENYIKESVNEYLNNNQDISSKDKENISKFVDEHSYKIVEKLPDTKEITNNLDPEFLSFIQKFFSSNTRLILGFIVCASIIGIILLQLKNKKYLLYLGTTFVIATIINLLFSLTINPLLTSLVNYNSNIVLSTIKLFANGIVKTYTITNVVILCISIILLIIYNVLIIKKTK